MATGIRLEELELRKLLGSGNGDACLLYLYIKAHGVLTHEQAMEDLHFDPRRLETALSLLTQLGLIAEPARQEAPAPEQHRYTTQDVLNAQKQDRDFGLLVGEAQRRLGRSLSGEELKTLLALHDFLKLPTAVIGLLISYCIRRSQSRGNGRMPSMRAIEKEGYAWAEQGIDSVERAAEHINRQLQRYTMAGKYRDLLGIRDRRLTGAEERYLLGWADMNLPEDVVALAYERTCVSTGGLKWSYMDAILHRWDDAGLRTVAAIESGDTKPTRNPPAYTRGRGAQPAPGDLRQPVAVELGSHEQRAIARQSRKREGEP